MRTFVLFALALTGTAVIADAADAGRRRNRGSNSGNCCGTPAVQATPCCGNATTAVGGYPAGYSGGMISGMTGTTVNGKATVIQAADGSVYTLGSDGKYYAVGSNPSTLGGFATRPYYGGSGYRSMYYPSGAYPAGYPGYGYPSGVYPAGGTTPLTMPGVNLPGGITIIPTPMPNK